MIFKSIKEDLNLDEWMGCYRMEDIRKKNNNWSSVARNRDNWRRFMREVNQYPLRAVPLKVRRMMIVFVFVWMAWSLLPNALRPFKIYY